MKGEKSIKIIKIIITSISFRFQNPAKNPIDVHHFSIIEFQSSPKVFFYNIYHFYLI